MRYFVRITKIAERSVLDHARWVQTETRSTIAAERCMEAIYAGVEELADLPTAHALAEEDPHRPYEVRKLFRHGYTILFSVDDEAKQVWILSGRGSGRRADPDLLPTELPVDEG